MGNRCKKLRGLLVKIPERSQRWVGQRFVEQGNAFLLADDFKQCGTGKGPGDQPLEAGELCLDAINKGVFERQQHGSDRREPLS